MKTRNISLYQILFEQDSSSSGDAEEIGAAVANVLKPEIEKLEKRFEQQTQQVATNALSTTGTKPTTGSGEEDTNTKIDKIEGQIKDTQGDVEDMGTKLGSLLGMAKKAQED